MPVPRTNLLRGLGRPLARAPRGSLRNGRVARRGYASEGAPKQSMSSEMPWILGAAAVTLPATFFIVSNGKFGGLVNHPLPGDAHHGEGHDEEHEEHEEDGEEGDEKEGDAEGQSEESEGKEDGGDEQKAEDGDDKGEDKGGDDKAAESKDDGEDDAEAGEDKKNRGGKASGKRVIEQPGDNKLGKAVKGGTDGEKAAWDQEHELESDSGSRRIHKPDAKGGAKRRIESPYGLKQGNSENDDDNNVTKKSPVAGNTSKQQAGISNTDTKHSYDLMKDPEKSKKPEGVPETAKLQGTVDPSKRPS